MNRIALLGAGLITWLAVMPVARADTIVRIGTKGGAKSPGDNPSAGSAQETVERSPQEKDRPPVAVASPAPTILTGSSFPPGIAYVVIDPATGQTVGTYTDSMRISPGCFITEQITGKVHAAADANGNLVSIDSAPADQWLAELESTGAQLEQLIADAMSKQTVTAVQGVPLRVELQAIASEGEGLKSSGRITLSQVAPLVYRLNVVISHIPVSLKKSGIAVRALMDGKIIVNNGTLFFATNSIVARRISLEQQIDGEYLSGRLTTRQVRELKERLEHITDLQMRNKCDGNLSDSRKHAINRRFDKLTASFHNDVSSTNKLRSRIGLAVD